MKKLTVAIIFLCIVFSCAGKSATPTGDQTATETPQQEEQSEHNSIDQHLNENWDDYLFGIIQIILGNPGMPGW